MKCLDLGCGLNKHDGCIGLDKKQVPGVDIVADITEGIPFPDNHFEKIICSNILEHFYYEEFEFVMSEIYRVSKPNGLIFIAVPHFSGNLIRMTLDHKLDKFYSRTFRRYDPEDRLNYYVDSKIKFKTILVRLGRKFYKDPTKKWLGIINLILSPLDIFYFLINIHPYIQYIYEEFFSHIIPADMMEVRLMAIKDDLKEEKSL